MPGRTKKQEDPASQDETMHDAPPSAQPEDTEVAEAAEAAEAAEQEEEPAAEPQRVRMFINEGHTMGNALRYIIMKNPDVEFCAYSIPHPSEPKMNLRIQTYEGHAIDVLRKGLNDLQDVCDVIADEFWAKRNEFNEEHGLDR